MCGSFREIYFFIFSLKKKKKERKKQAARKVRKLNFCWALYSDLEDGGGRLLRNVYELLPG
jgi:hypothetical protein